MARLKPPWILQILTVIILILPNLQPYPNSDQIRRRSSFLVRPSPFVIQSVLLSPLSVEKSPFPPLSLYLTSAIEPSDLDYFPGHSQSPGPNTRLGAVATIGLGSSQCNIILDWGAVATIGAGSYQ